MQKTEPISFRLPPATKDALTNAAAADHRSVSSLLEKIVSDWLRDNGYFEKAKARKTK